MKIGEIKLESLVIMNIANDTKLKLDNYINYLNENKYKKYLLNMDESIKRAVDIINTKGVLRQKIIQLKNLKYVAYQNNIVITDIYSQITDLYKINLVVKYGDSLDNLYYNLFGDELIIENFNSSDEIENIRIIYTPKIIIDSFDIDTELPLPNHLARIIPYYIKYDLYQEDEPELAILSRDTFYSILENYVIDYNNNQTYIDRVFEV